jgi:hypothetical protein
MKREEIILIGIAVLAALYIEVADAANLLGKSGITPYSFNKEWREGYHEKVTYGKEKDLIDIYWDDDELFFYNGMFYLDNPDRGFQMIPLYFDTDWEKQEFEQDFLRYIDSGDSEEFIKSVNNPMGTGCKWGFFLHDGMFFLYRYDM